MELAAGGDAEHDRAILFQGEARVGEANGGQVARRTADGTGDIEAAEQLDHIAEVDGAIADDDLLHTASVSDAIETGARREGLVGDLGGREREQRGRTELQGSVGNLGDAFTVGSGRLAHVAALDDDVANLDHRVGERDGLEGDACLRALSGAEDHGDRLLQHAHLLTDGQRGGVAAHLDRGLCADAATDLRVASHAAVQRIADSGVGGGVAEDD